MITIFLSCLRQNHSIFHQSRTTHTRVSTVAYNIFAWFFRKFIPNFFDAKLIAISLIYLIDVRNASHNKYFTNFDLLAANGTKQKQNQTLWHLFINKETNTCFVSLVFRSRFRSLCLRLLSFGCVRSAHVAEMFRFLSLFLFRCFFVVFIIQCSSTDSVSRMRDDSQLQMLKCSFK